MNHAMFLAGSDEVGRGPLAGPVVACSVVVPRESVADFLAVLGALKVSDSKQLSEKKRTYILKELNIDLSKLQTEKCYEFLGAKFVISALSSQEIDQHNILRASMMAMEKSFRALALNGSVWWMVDGNKAPCQAPLDHTIECVVKGDQKSLIIGIASIIAKAYRDSLMTQYALEYPGYGLEKHAGYPTAFHREAIASLGPSAIHRLSFKGVKEYVGATKI